MAFVIDNEPRAYDWGAPGALGRLRGSVSRAFHTGTSIDGVFPVTDADAPEAELWLGTHPAWPSVVAEGPRAGQSLPTALAAEGRPVDVGFLLKLLAIERPLSVQVHPDAVQARAGFAREEAAGVPIDAPQREYRDPNAKPEMIFVLSDVFELCAGFRPAEEIAADVEALAALDTDPAWSGLLAALADEAPIEAAAHRLLDADRAGARQATARLQHLHDAGRLTGALPDETRGALLARLLETYPGDPGTAFSLLLHHQRLQRGQAAYLRPRTPHFYISGVGVELMGPSDNVLRAGLTSKHVDAAELLRVLDFDAEGPERLFEYHKGPMTVFHAAGAGLRLAFTRAHAQGAIDVPFHDGDIAYVLRGALTLVNTDGTVQHLGTGQAALLVDVARAEFADDAAGHGMVLVAGATEVVA